MGSQADCWWRMGQAGAQASRLNLQNLVKCENSNQSQLSWISAVPGWERKVKFMLLFLFQIQTLVNLVLGCPVVSLSGTPSYCLLVCLEFVLRTWLGFLSTWGTQVVGSCVCRQLHRQVGGSKIWLDRNMGCTSFVVESHWLLSALRESFMSFSWLSLGVALDIGRIVSFASCLGMPPLSMGSFSVAGNVYYLYELKPDKVF